jgi:hypothetical protein
MVQHQRVSVGVLEDGHVTMKSTPVMLIGVLVTSSMFAQTSPGAFLPIA